MRSMSFGCLVAGALAAVLAVPLPAAPAASGVGVVEHFGQHAWTNWEASVIKAQGFGVAPASATSSGQAVLLARRAAVVDAYRNLLEASLDVAVRSRTAVEAGGVKWDTIETQVEGVVRNAGILEEKQLPDGRYAVVLSMPIYGQGSVGSVVLPGVFPQQPGGAPALPPRTTPVLPPRVPLPRPGGPYTGLVVVVQGHLDRSMSPAILTPGGEVVYGRGWWKPGQISPELANQQGIVGYSSSAQSPSRAGAHPLIVYAIGTTGPALSNFKTDAVISNEDASKIEQANAEGHFLEQLRVDLVVAP